MRRPSGVRAPQAAPERRARGGTPPSGASPAFDRKRVAVGRDGAEPGRSRAQAWSRPNLDRFRQMSGRGRPTSARDRSTFAPEWTTWPGIDLPWSRTQAGQSPGSHRSGLVRGQDSGSCGGRGRRLARRASGATRRRAPPRRPGPPGPLGPGRARGARRKKAKHGSNEAINMCKRCSASGSATLGSIPDLALTFSLKFHASESSHQGPRRSIHRNIPGYHIGTRR